MNRQWTGKAWQTLFLPRLSTKEVEELDKGKGAVVLPVGAVEQHGDHLPIYTDTLIAEGVVTEAFEHLSLQDNVWLLPPLPFGKSTEHQNHPGTVTLTSETLQNVVMDIAESIQRSGFRRLVLFNAHGGNSDLLNMMAREIRIKTGLMVFRANAMDGRPEIEHNLSEKEKRYGIHGGDVETSLVLALEEEWVNMTRASNECYSPFFENEVRIDIKGGPSVAWIADDVSESGTSGCAGEASKERGETFLPVLGEYFAKTLQVIAAFEMKALKGTMSQTK
ncbi:creatininase family protein [Salibacterium aidingense]|uniref:creatininase family protein n=1 Tax=Salibacterium aidingense TaxID=384933 RepID=UPI000404A930|nr:creatininase family protein [Salibacterium aidingense]